MRQRSRRSTRRGHGRARQPSTKRRPATACSARTASGGAEREHDGEYHRLGPGGAVDDEELGVPLEHREHRLADAVAPQRREMHETPTVRREGARHSRPTIRPGRGNERSVAARPLELCGVPAAYRERSEARRRGPQRPASRRRTRRARAPACRRRPESSTDRSRRRLHRASADPRRPRLDRPPTRRGDPPPSRECELLLRRASRIRPSRESAVTHDGPAAAGEKNALRVRRERVPGSARASEPREAGSVPRRRHEKDIDAVRLRDGTTSRERVPRTASDPRGRTSVSWRRCVRSRRSRRECRVPVSDRRSRRRRAPERTQFGAHVRVERLPIESDRRVGSLLRHEPADRSSTKRAVGADSVQRSRPSTEQPFVASGGREDSGGDALRASANVAAALTRTDGDPS